ncbi:hypothetical protein Gotri_005920 [Gossypium trilobum]|uniref:2-C-methyl-D-erythritol 4-phosphate cytidylyltransferase n=1 Tax=Gossypium trilobum TaxID=34281 RepID=A0A7J9EZ59_9ROSI|nr:hypothetical protein [Gossypium trilobum]
MLPPILSLPFLTFTIASLHQIEPGRILIGKALPALIFFSFGASLFFFFRAKSRFEKKGQSPYLWDQVLVFTQGSAVVNEKSVSVILLAGGKGKRMGASMPKQYLPLLGQPIALYSSSGDTPCNMMIFVAEAKDKINVDLKFTLPGKERQDSVYSGLQAVDLNSELVCIHDSARPLVRSGDVEKVLKDGWLIGAAVLGVPVKATIKEANSDSYVVKTLDRKTLWEMQTPQVYLLKEITYDIIIFLRLL